MNAQDKYTNIIGYIDREIVARVQNNKEIATYYFSTPDRTAIEAVSFRLKGGAVSSTAVLPKDAVIQYIYNTDKK